jgi:hypothetical protein
VKVAALEQWSRRLRPRGAVVATGPTEPLETTMGRSMKASSFQFVGIAKALFSAEQKVASALRDGR